MSIRLTLIVPYLNSHEIVRRQLLFLERERVDQIDGLEIFYMDDGSDPPLQKNGPSPTNLKIIPTFDTRPWTSSLARNMGAKLAKGEYLFMIDGDFIVNRKAIETAMAFDGDRLGIRRELGVLDEDGNFTQDLAVLAKWGVPEIRLKNRGAAMPPHPNHYIIKKQIFWDLGGYDEKLILERPYPQGEDNYLKKKWCRARDAGIYKDPDPHARPMVYMFPNGQFCGDVDANPFGLFHTLSRKSWRNPWQGNRFANG